MDAVKVCFVTSNYPPEANGGTEQVAAALLHELGARGVDGAVLSGSDRPDDGGQVHDEVHRGVPVRRVFKTTEEWSQQAMSRPRVLAAVDAWLGEQRPDVVHVHSNATLGCGIAGVCRDRGVPVVLTFHDLWTICPLFFRVPRAGVTCPTGAGREPCFTCVADALGTDVDFARGALPERDRWIRAEVAAASACTAPSRTAAAFVARCLPYEGRIEVIPHGLVREVAAADRAAPPRYDEPLRIGTFGGLVFEKGVPELIEAVAPLAGCELHLSGRLHDERVAALLERHARAGLECHYHGAYGAADPHPARRLHLAVFPSKCQETYGLVVDEALAHGVPVVCSDSGALAERADTPGVVVTPLEGLRQTLADLIASRDRLAALRRAIPARLPTIAASAERHLQLYRSLT